MNELVECDLLSTALRLDEPETGLAGMFFNVLILPCSPRRYGRTTQLLRVAFPAGCFHPSDIAEKLMCSCSKCL